MAKNNARNGRKSLYRQQGGRCYYCNRQTVLPKRGKCFGFTPHLATLDHIIPRSQGGARGPTLNCVMACQKCNSERGSTDARLFLLKKQELIDG